MKLGLGSLLLAGGLIFASFGVTAARAAGPFKLTSPAFADNARWRQNTLANGRETRTASAKASRRRCNGRTRRTGPRASLCC